jgi:GNAT superfamily N-acetyltransferase
MTTAPITLRRLLPEELAWTNARYAEVDFVPSSEHDLGLLASCDGAPAGIGRIVPLGGGAGELGGMLVFDRFQGRGIARELLAGLFALPGFEVLYCVPFAELEGLYASMGFVAIDDGPGVPAPISKKVQWCLGHYPKPVILMRRLSPRV